MQILHEFPHRVEEIEHLEIPMPDGCRLAARLWMPEDAATNPVPAILEYIPYRKNDLTAGRDAVAHPFVAGHGYACLRVDLRGSGESDGVLRDEYLQQELDDGAQAIAWIAAQPWCDGNVGMIGISWGGFNGLQIAAMQPPALKAVITCSSTDDRYADDVHYMGGCLLTDNLSWASIMFGRNTCPPDPRLVGERWREMWHARLKDSGLWIEPWLEHQTRDAYWRHGSVCEDFSRIRCPVYAVGGWADGYVNAVFRLLQGLDVPRKGLIGPWAHTYPHLGRPGPAIGFLQDALRWWDHWLKGRDTGLMDEPMLRAWIQDSAPPRTAYAHRPGRWVAEPCWPAPNVRPEELRLGGDGSLASDADGGVPPAALAISSPLTIGFLGGKWCSYAVPGDQPGDQRTEDAGSLVFETAPLQDALDILGETVLELDLESDRPVAMIAARLNDVAPDGAATRVTYGLLNLTHRDSHDSPQPLVPGRRYRISVPLKHVGQRFAAGHRLRLALSTSYWPIAWAPPEPVTLTVHPGASRLRLPVRAAGAGDGSLPAFPEAMGAAPLDRQEIEAPESAWHVTHDLARDEHGLEIRAGHGTVRFPDTGLTVTTRGLERYTVTGGDCASQRGEVRWSIAFSRDGWRVETITHTVLTCDAEAFHVTAELEAYENGALAHKQAWRRDIRRHLV